MLGFNFYTFKCAATNTAEDRIRLSGVTNVRGQLKEGVKSLCDVGHQWNKTHRRSPKTSDPEVTQNDIMMLCLRTDPK